MLSEEDRATATGNMYGKFGEIWTVVFEICVGQTDKQTDRLIAIFHTPTGGKVEISISHSRRYSIALISCLVRDRLYESSV